MTAEREAAARAASAARRAERRLLWDLTHGAAQNLASNRAALAVLRRTLRGSLPEAVRAELVTLEESAAARVERWEAVVAGDP